MSAKNQCTRILAYLKSGRTLTALDALDRFECNRLAARIRDLKDDGHDISRRMIQTASGKTVAEYFIA